MGRFSVPSSPARNVVKIETFKGVDLNSSPSNVEITRSPNAPNMMRDVPGKVRKRQGYERIAQFSGKRINGVHILRSAEKNEERVLIHAGDSLYLEGKAIYTAMADERSVGRQFYGKLFIFDGKKALCYGEFETEEAAAAETETDKAEKPKAFMVKTLEDAAYIPTVIISRKPTGGGTTLEPLNLIGRKWKESFLSDGTAKVYQLTAKDLDADKVAVRIMTKEGEWTDKKEGTDFTVDRKNGTVTFTTAPGASPVTGYDNVEITAAKTRKGYAEKINKCKIISLFGVNGAMDRMFLSGNPDFPNRDWYCKMADGFFWGDLWYSTLGQDGSAIVGYSIINDRLAAHKSDAEEGRNVILRKGEMGEKDATFPIIGTLTGRGALGSHTFGYLGSEPLFLTDIGIMAITAADLTGEKYSQSRSYYIDNALTAEKGLADAYAYIWRDFYLISTGGGRVYLLDWRKATRETTLQQLSIRMRLGECAGKGFLGGCRGGALLLGMQRETSSDLRRCDEPKSYNDNGKAISARWDTAELPESFFYKNKNFRRLDFVLAPAIATGAKVFAQVKGVWSEIFDSGARAMYFDFTHINWERINFSTDDTPRTIGGKIKIKKVDKVAFSLRNEQLNEPFGIYSLAMEYTENGNYKG